MISRHLYPFIIIGILSVGMYMQWQHNKYLNLELSTIKQANSELASSVEGLQQAQKSINEALGKRDEKRDKLNEQLASQLEKIFTQPDDGCLDRTVPDKLLSRPVESQTYTD